VPRDLWSLVDVCGTYLLSGAALQHRYKQKTPPVVAGQWMRGRLSTLFYPQLRLPVM
jgi:hypothetical protein